MTFTVLGGGGFIGRALANNLLEKGQSVYVPECRHSTGLPAEVFKRDLGHVFYCIGLTADFREQLFDTVEAHVCVLKSLLAKGRMSSLTYLSSTRVYDNSLTSHETSVLQGVPGNPGHLYNFSKMLGESLCLCNGQMTKVVRLSNVYGHQMEAKNFLAQVLQEAARTGQVRFLSSSDYARDYLALADVIRLLPLIATEGRFEIYNLASGKSTTNAEIAEILAKEGIKSYFEAGLSESKIPIIDIKRLTDEFGATKINFTADLLQLLQYFRSKGKI